ncbi:MAG: hypothetical protein HQL53_09725 [Magnetococcales bacterium]|nr:hypothetical protein [Magnetococcales bacterium]
MLTGQWIEIFRAGEYGRKGRFSIADLDQIVTNFSGSDQVPIVVGHPQTDSPAWGWLTRIKREGESLLAKVGKLHQTFSQALAENKFRNRSVKVVKTKAGWKLAHLGFLGAELPGVEGMSPISMSDDGDKQVTIEMQLSETTNQEDSMPDAKDGTTGVSISPQEVAAIHDQLKDANARLKEAEDRASKAEAERQKADDDRRAAEFSAWVDGQVKAGSIPSAKKSQVASFMMALPTGDEAAFSWGDGEKTSADPVAWFRKFVEEKKPSGMEFSGRLPDGPDEADESSDSVDYTKMTANM